MGPHSLVVLTFNIWGLLHVSRRRSERIAGLADELAGCGADIVALQVRLIMTQLRLSTVLSAVLSAECSAQPEAYR